MKRLTVILVVVGWNAIVVANGGGVQGLLSAGASSVPDYRACPGQGPAIVAKASIECLDVGLPTTLGSIEPAPVWFISQFLYQGATSWRRIG